MTTGKYWTRFVQPFALKSLQQLRLLPFPLFAASSLPRGVMCDHILTGRRSRMGPPRNSHSVKMKRMMLP